MFWRPQMTGATVLFFGTRYIGLLAYSFLGAATYAPMTDTVCHVSPHRLSHNADDRPYTAEVRIASVSVKVSGCTGSLGSCTGIVTAQLSVAVVQYMFWAGK